MQTVILPRQRRIQRVPVTSRDNRAIRPFTRIFRPTVAPTTRAGGDANDAFSARIPESRARSVASAGD